MTDSTRLRRRTIREIGDLLHSDLYQRGASHGDEDSETSATWWSPLKLSVTYGYDDEQRVWIRCRDSKGRIYVETQDGDADWLYSEML